jgi:hypothetical protein
MLNIYCPISAEIRCKGDEENAVGPSELCENLLFLPVDVRLLAVVTTDHLVVVAVNVSYRRTSALDGGRESTSRPGHFLPTKTTRYP